jgi:hypothetical protein
MMLFDRPCMGMVYYSMAVFYFSFDLVLISLRPGSLGVA